MGGVSARLAEGEGFSCASKAEANSATKMQDAAANDLVCMRNVVSEVERGWYQRMEQGDPGGSPLELGERRLLDLFQLRRDIHRSTSDFQLPLPRLVAGLFHDYHMVAGSRLDG